MIYYIFTFYEEKEDIYMMCYKEIYGMHDICVTKRYIRIDKVSAVAVNRVGCRWGGCWGRELAQGKRGGR